MYVCMYIPGPSVEHYYLLEVLWCSFPIKVFESNISARLVLAKLRILLMIWFWWVLVYFRLPMI